jgi:PEP-CTERM motif
VPQLDVRQKIIYNHLINMKTTCLLLITSFYYLAGAPVISAAVINPSFEVSLAGWTSTWGNSLGVFHHASTATSGLPSYVNGVPSDGNGAGRIIRFVDSTITTGQFASLSQVVDLTGVTSITFDAALDIIYMGNGNNDWSSSSLEAAFLISGVDYWVKNSGGSYLSQKVNTASVVGLQTIEFQLRARSALGGFGSDWFIFDNLSINNIPEPTSALLFGFGALGILGFRSRKI